MTFLSSLQSKENGLNYNHEIIMNVFLYINYNLFKILSSNPGSYVLLNSVFQQFQQFLGYSSRLSKTKTIFEAD